jgi:recombinational DNA repair ATPase RecF
LVGEAALPMERARAMTTVGPHRDDLDRQQRLAPEADLAVWNLDAGRVSQ